MTEINEFVGKAERFLTTADHALKIGDYDSCVSRSYYAMFFLVEAVLLTKEMSASSHKRVISLFGEHFVKEGIFERDLGRALGDAYDKRLAGDYGIGLAISKEEAAELLGKAKNFVLKLKNYLENWMKKQEK